MFKKIIIIFTWWVNRKDLEGRNVFEGGSWAWTMSGYSIEALCCPYGIRSVSLYHKDHPFVIRSGGIVHEVDYEPAESTDSLFGGNSNWRGLIWLPINYLIIKSLQKYHHYYGDDFKIECPTGSGRFLTAQKNLNKSTQTHR